MVYGIIIRGSKMDKNWYMLSIGIETEDHYYGGYEIEFPKEIQLDDRFYHLDPDEVSVLQQGIQEYNENKKIRVCLSKIIVKDSPGLSFNSLMNMGKKKIEDDLKEKEIRQQRAQKAKETKERNKLEKLAKEAGICVEQLLKLKES
ncbi:hypothetical protein [Aeromonas phage 4L372D]|uniref:Uncharacterized protein n=1 Tax=Aeromonas phage 4L372D TaxID=2588518 RepID=A0A5B9N332_9CAUD|nr:hypothetical protein HWC27_gp053 [Aeromonas phage 4L372D]QEG08517.1 hypothetical protein [Aeromonas phage 4L372D]